MALDLITPQGLSRFAAGLESTSNEKVKTGKPANEFSRLSCFNLI
jgi:hypothetical protein